MPKLRLHYGQLPACRRFACPNLGYFWGFIKAVMRQTRNCGVRSHTQRPELRRPTTRSSSSPPVTLAFAVCCDFGFLMYRPSYAIGCTEA